VSARLFSSGMGRIFCEGQGSRTPSLHFFTVQQLAHTLSMAFVRSGRLSIVITSRKSPSCLPCFFGTEVIEHFLGLCRQIVKDFTETDFRAMEPKLVSKIRQAIVTEHRRWKALPVVRQYIDYGRGINMTALSLDPRIETSTRLLFGNMMLLFSVGFPWWFIQGVLHMRLRQSFRVARAGCWMTTLFQIVRITHASDLSFDEEGLERLRTINRIDSLDSARGISQQSNLTRYRYATMHARG